MLKNKIFAFVSIISAFCSMSFSKGFIVANITFHDQTFGPFTKTNQYETISIYYDFWADRSYFDLQERVTIYEEKKDFRHMVYTKTSPCHVAKPNRTYNFDFEFNGYQMFGIRNLCILVVEILSEGSNRILETKQIEFRSYNPNVTYTEHEARNIDIVGSSGFFNLSKKNGVPHEEYSFKMFPYEFQDAPYHYLDVSNLKFLYESNVKFTYDSAYFTFLDKDNLFSDFEGINNSRYLPINLIQSGNEISISFPTMFVNPSNLHMSTFAQKDYVETNKLFMPLNHKNSFIDTDWILHLDGLGYSKINTKLILKYYPSSVLIGDCSGSDYCIVGGVKNG